MTREELAAELTAARIRVDELERAIKRIDTAPENNVFASLEEAERVLAIRLECEASEDCEGAGNCGADAYVQEFIVDGTHYIGTLEVEYNRHDKTYYYIESTNWWTRPKTI